MVSGAAVGMCVHPAMLPPFLLQPLLTASNLACPSPALLAAHGGRCSCRHGGAHCDVPCRHNQDSHAGAESSGTKSGSVQCDEGQSVAGAVPYAMKGNKAGAGATRYAMKKQSGRWDRGQGICGGFGTGHKKWSGGCMIGTHNA